MGNKRQFFDFDTMAVVLYVMLESGVILSKEHFSMMSAIDGTRGPDGFSHQFRKVKARAKEIQEKMKKGVGVGAPVKKTRGGSNKAKSTPSRSEGKKCVDTIKKPAEGDDDTRSDNEIPSKVKEEIVDEVVDDPGQFFVDAMVYEDQSSETNLC